MPDFIIQRVPGYLAPDNQVALATDVIHTAAELLQFSERDDLERGLETMQKPLLSLIAAGVLSEITFALHDEDSVCGVTISFDSYNMKDFEEVDLSHLRLAASTTGTGSIEIVCLDGAVAEAVSQMDWLPPAHPNLAWYQVQQNENLEDHQLSGEEE
jgi:hypothetical protein